MKKTNIRIFIARFLPKRMRNLFGGWYFAIHESMIRPFLGLVFDMLGGYFRVDGCKIKVPKDLTTRTYRGCFMMSDYEAEERSLIKKHLLASDSVLELGACIGVVACVTNRLLSDKSRHLVVEGNPKLIPYIERNRDINGCGFNVVNKAASQEKAVTFYLNEEFIVGGTSQRKSPHPVQVEGITLQELNLEHGPFSALIMDIEGGEVDTIPYSLEFLKRCRLVIWETHDWACGHEGTDRCRQTLAEAGLQHIDTEGDTEAWLRVNSAI